MYFAFSLFESDLQATARAHWISGHVLNSHSIVSSSRTIGGGTGAAWA